MVKEADIHRSLLSLSLSFVQVAYSKSFVGFTDDLQKLD